MSVLGDLMYLLNTDAKLSAVLNVLHTHTQTVRRHTPKNVIRKKKEIQAKD